MIEKSKENILFSVLVANYNNSLFLPDAIESVISQTYSNWELIILDDFSTDNSVYVIKDYALRDSRIFFFQNEKNCGVGYTKKKLIDLAKGEILGFFDSDDVLLANALEIMIKEHNENPNCSLIYSTHYMCDDKLNIININKDICELENNESYYTSKNKIHCIGHFATFKKSFYLLNEKLDVTLKKAIDQDLYLKLEEVGKLKFLNIPLYFYRHNSNSISLNKNGWKAFLWEVRVKEKTYYRRKINSIAANLSKKTIFREYYYAYKQLALENLNDKNYLEYSKYCLLFFVTFKNPVKGIKFVYYTLKKHFFYKKFAQKGNF